MIHYLISMSYQKRKETRVGIITRYPLARKQGRKNMNIRHFQVPAISSASPLSLESQNSSSSRFDSN